MASSKKTMLEQLFDSHATGLVRYLTRKLKSAQDAEDIAQNAFIRIQRLAESGDLDNPKAYLYQTASNLAIDQIRREKLHSNYLHSEVTRQLADYEVPGAHADYCTPERLLGAKQQLNEMDRAIGKLPLKCRQAFLLHRIKGLSYAEIAQDMGISVSSVEKYILQALKACRKALERVGASEI